MKGGVGWGGKRWEDGTGDEEGKGRKAGVYKGFERRRGVYCPFLFEGRRVLSGRLSLITEQGRVQCYLARNLTEQKR